MPAAPSKGGPSFAKKTTALPPQPQFPARTPRLLEPLILLLSAPIYYASIRFLAPTYLTDILPLLRDTYWAFGNLTFPQLLQQSIQLHLLAVVTLAAYLQTPRRPTPTLLLIAATAATLAFYLQSTGWYYQQLPALTLFSLALGTSLLDMALEPYPQIPQPNPTLTAALCILALILTWHFSDFDPQPIPDPTFYTPNTSVATLTTSVDDTVPPAFTHDLQLAQRYPHLWLLPAILRNQSGPRPTHLIPPARLAVLERLQHQYMLEDLQHWHPDLILVARCQDPNVHCQVLEDRHDNLLAWFARDPAFQHYMQQYHFWRSSGPYDAYRRTP